MLTSSFGDKTLRHFVMQEYTIFKRSWANKNGKFENSEFLKSFLFHNFWIKTYLTAVLYLDQFELWYGMVYLLLQYFTR